MRCMQRVGLVAAVFLAAGSSVWAAPTATVVATRGKDPKLAFEWSMEAVQLAGLADAEVQRAVNAALKQRVRTERETMARALEGWERQADPSTLWVGMSVTLLTERVVSVKMEVESQYAGAAHQNRSLRGVTFDLVTGKELTLNDLVAAAPEARERLASLVDAALRKDPDNYWDGEVAEDAYRFEQLEADAITDVVLVDGGVRFLFGDFQLGAGYNAGTAEVDLPAAQLAGLLGPAYLSDTRGLTGALGR